MRARYSKPDSRFEISLRISESSVPERFGELRSCTGRVLDLVRRGEDARRVLGQGKVGACAVVDRAADARDLDHLGLLALRVGAKLAALNGLKPRGPEESDGEEKEKAGEEQAESTIDQAHGVTPPPVSATTGVVGGVVTSVVAVAAVVRRDGRDPSPAGAAAGSSGGSGRIDHGASTGPRATGGDVCRSEREVPAAEASRRLSGVSGRRRQHQDRGRLGHDQADANRGLLKPLVRKAVGDVGAQRRVGLAELVGEPGRLRRRGVEGESHDVQGDDADQERAEDADP